MKNNIIVCAQIAFISISVISCGGGGSGAPNVPRNLTINGTASQPAIPNTPVDVNQSNVLDNTVPVNEQASSPSSPADGNGSGATPNQPSTGNNPNTTGSGENSNTENPSDNGDGSATLPNTPTDGGGSNDESNGSEETSPNSPVEDNTDPSVNNTSGEPSEPNSGATEGDDTNNTDTSATSENGENTNTNPPVADGSGSNDVNHSGTENPSNDGGGSTSSEADTNTGGSTPTEENQPSAGDTTATDGNTSSDQNTGGEETSPNPPVEDNTASSLNDNSGEQTQPNSGATESDATNNADTSAPSDNGEGTNANPPVADGNGTSDVNHGGTENPSNDGSGSTSSEADTNVGGSTPTEENQPSAGDTTATDGNASSDQNTGSEETAPNNGDGSATLPNTPTDGSGSNDESNGSEETAPNPSVADGSGSGDVNNSGTENPSNGDNGATTSEESNPSAGDDATATDGNTSGGENGSGSETAPNNGDGSAPNEENKPTQPEENSQPTNDNPNTTDGGGSSNESNGGEETSPNPPVEDNTVSSVNDNSGEPSEPNSGATESDATNNTDTSATSENGENTNTNPPVADGSGSTSSEADTNVGGSTPTEENKPSAGDTTATDGNTSGGENAGGSETAPNNGDGSASSEENKPTQPEENSQPTNDNPNTTDGSGSTSSEADTNVGGSTPTEENQSSVGDTTTTDGNTSGGQNNDGSETAPSNDDGSASSEENKPTQPEENGQPTNDSPNTTDGSGSGDVNNSGTENPSNGDNGTTTSEESNPSAGNNSNTAGSGSSNESNDGEETSPNSPVEDNTAPSVNDTSGEQTQPNSGATESDATNNTGTTPSDNGEGTNTDNPPVADGSSSTSNGADTNAGGSTPTEENQPSAGDTTAADGNASSGENAGSSQASSDKGGGSDVPPNKPDEVVNPPENTDSPVADDVPVNNPPETRVERYRPENMEASNHDENTVMKISVIDVDFSNKNDTYDAFKRPDGRLRLHLNQGTDRVAKGNNKSHGTMVAGVIAKHNSTSEIYGYTTDSNGNVSVTNLDFEAAYNNGVRIFNNSWGNNVEDDRYRLESVWKDRLGYPNAIDEFIGKKAATDSIFIFATGNDRKIRPKTGNYPTTQSHYPVEYPEAKRGFLAVTSVAWGDQSVRDYANKLGPLAKYWGIASYGEHSLFNNEAQTQGTSFATPVVSAAVADVWEKFPWMNNHLVVQSILSTADKPKSNGVVTDGPNEDTGWGVLNKDRALKGPARFDRRLLTESDNGYVVADFAYRNYANPDRLTFSNNIAGDAGFKKRGTGMLYFTGNNSYTGDTIVEKGYLSVAGDLSHSKVSIEKEGTLIAKNDEKKVRFGDSSVADYAVSNKGSLEVLGQGLTITGNYQAEADARTVIDINTASLDVTGTADMGGSRIVAHIEKVQEVPKKEHEKTILTAGTLSNYHNDYAVSDYVNPYIQIKELKQDNNHVKVKFVRNNTDAVLNALALGSSSSRNTGRNLDKAFDEVANNPNSALSSQAVSILNASPLALGRTIDSLSAEIYASAPNAVWNQSIANKQKNAERVLNDHAGVWADTGYNTYKIAQNGFASGDSKAHQTSFGVDKQFDNLMLGVSVNTGEIKTDFDRSAGNSKIRTHGIHVHGGVDWNPWYAFANVGMSWTQNKVNRSLNIANNADKIDFKQNGKIYHLYGEVGYQFNHFTPFVAYSLDSVHQNAINEGKTFGIQAPARTHNISSYIAGVRSSVNIKDLRLNASLAHIYTPKADFDFTAKFVGASHDIDIKGVQVARHQTMMNAGFYYPMSEAWSVFGSYSLSRNKHSNHQGIHLGAKYRF